MSLLWSNSRSLRLIKLYRSYEVLWNPMIDYYKDKNKKIDAWNEIAKEMKVERIEIERKMKNLLCHFHREYKKVTNSKSGSGTKDEYVSKWFGFKSLLFVKHKNKSRNTIESEVPALEDSEEEIIPKREIVDEEVQNTTDAMVTKDNDEYSENTGITEGGGTESDTEGSSKFVSRNKNCTKIKGKFRPNADLMTMKAFRIMASLKERLARHNTSRDEYDTFGEQVAFKVRKLKTNYAKEVVEHMINTILFEASIGKYDHPLSTSHGSQIYPSNSSLTSPASASSLYAYSPSSTVVNSRLSKARRHKK